MKKILFVLTLLLMMPLFAMKPVRIKWPEDIAPRDNFPKALELNAYADVFLKHNKIRFTATVPKVKEQLSPMAVFELNLSIIQLLHHHELQLGLRPIPIVTTSPIKYYPADVHFLSELIIGRLKRIAKFYKIKNIPMPKVKLEETIGPQDVFVQTLLFYQKLLALSGTKEISADQIYNESFRAVQELRNIVIHLLPKIRDVRSRRILAASLHGLNPYGGSKLRIAKDKKRVEDVYEKSIQIREELIPLLKRYRVHFTALPKKPKKHPTTLDAFIEAQIILAELSQWKDVIDVETSTPVTVLAKEKTYTDVYQELQEIEFILDKLSSTS